MKLWCYGGSNHASTDWSSYLYSCVLFIVCFVHTDYLPGNEFIHKIEMTSMGMSLYTEMTSMGMSLYTELTSMGKNLYTEITSMGMSLYIK